MTFLIDSDKINDYQFLDAFCSNNILSTLQKLNNLGIYLINYSLIQALSFLLVNLTNNTTTYYIYSNNILNEMITITIQNYDDEYLSYYINFLKSIALRIETDTIQFFYNENTNSFPIVENALKLYNYSNPMISTVVHNIMLGILNVRYEPVTGNWSIRDKKYLGSGNTNAEVKYGLERYNALFIIEATHSTYDL